MGGAIAEGLLNIDDFVPSQLTVCDHNKPVLDYFAGKGAVVIPDNCKAAI